MATWNPNPTICRIIPNTAFELTHKGQYYTITHGALVINIPTRNIEKFFNRLRTTLIFNNRLVLFSVKKNNKITRRHDFMLEDISEDGAIA